MKLSQAIRKGCEMVPRQAIGVYCDRTTGAMAACAFGAAGVARLGLSATFHDLLDESARGARAMCDISARCPEGCDDGDIATAYKVVTHLNDDHRWSREQIADWLDEQGL